MLKNIMKICPLLLLMGIADAKTPNFSGDWGYHVIGCDFEYMGGMRFIQKGATVRGIWDEGSPQGIGFFGKLRGEIKGDQLFVYFCSDDGQPHSAYPECPKYQKKSETYFIIKNKRLIRYNLIGEKPSKQRFEKATTPFYKGKVPTKKGGCAK